MPRHPCLTPGTLLRAPRGPQTHGPPPHGWDWRSSHLAGGMPGSEWAAGESVPPWDVALRGWVQAWRWKMGLGSWGATSGAEK